MSPSMSMPAASTAPAPAPALAPPHPPRRFRRRLVALVLAAGLAPLLLWGLLALELVDRALALAPPLEPLLARSAVALEGQAAAAPIVAEIAAARLHLAQADLARRALQRRAPIYLGLVALVSGLVVAAAALVVARPLARRVDALVVGMEHVAAGDLERGVPERRRASDELDVALAAFNRMGRELARQRARLQVTLQIAAWQGVARTLAHELRNPLTAMKMAVARLDRPAPAPEAIREAAALLGEEIALLLRLVTSFSEFARLPPPAPRPTPLGPIVEEIAALYAHQAAAVPVVARAAGAPVVDADPDQLRRALGNLVKNAIEASAPGDAPVEIDVEPQGAGRVRVLVADGGAGIPAPIEGAALARALGSTKAEGSGIGLPVAHKIVHDHGGSLRLEPRTPKGTLAIVELPVAAPRGVIA